MIGIKWRLSLAVALLLLLVQLPAPAQDMHFKTIEVEWNNQPVKVLRLLQDSQGYVWLGTSEGLFRYTGTDYKHFPLSSDSIAQSVTTLYEDSQQQLWVGFENGTLAKLKDQKLISVLASGSINTPITAIHLDNSQTLWVATYGQGVLFRQQNKFRRLSLKSGLPDDYTYTLAPDKSGRVWIGTDRGIGICSVRNGRARVEVLDSGKGLPDNIVTSLKSLPSGDLWIGMESAGICKYNWSTKKITVPVASQSWQWGRVTQLLPQSNGLWIGTNGNGVLWLDKQEQSITPAVVASDVAKLKVSDLITDKEGHIWIAANTSKLFRAYPGLRISSGDKWHNVHAVLSAKDKSLWFSTDDGLFRQSNGKVQQFLQTQDQYQVVSLYEDAWGYIWGGTLGQGVFRLNPENGNYIQLSTRQGLVNENVLAIAGKGNTIWLATLGGVSKCVLIGKPGTAQPTYQFQNFTQQNGLGINYIYQVFIDSKDRVWFATDGKGLTMLQNGKFFNFSEKDGLQSKTVYSITEDIKGHIWFSTLNAGIYRFNGKSFRNYSLRDGLHDLNITSIKADQSGRILVMHRQGLDVLHPETGNVLFYGKDAGVTEPDPDLNVASVGKDGRIWFGTQNGIISYDPAFATAQYKPLTRLQDTQVFFKSVLGQKQAIFAHDKNHITFDYTGLWYQNPEDVTYQVKLDGYDPDWIDSRNHTITYPNLPPGKYVFNVSSSATSDFKDADVVTYPFEIRPPFWRTPWFYMLSFIAAGSGLYLFVKGREKRLRKAERQEKDKVMFQFETLKSQVNPHFLFNSFNTLVSTIEEDPDAAVVYVERLSDFFRVMLMLREKNLIPLREELNLIRDYTFLQQQRYQENLSVTIDVPEVALDKMVAPLTLQLLLENAIKHNVISKAKPLFVTLTVQDDYVMVQNNYQPKQTPEVSTGIGLQNIRSRYHILSRRNLKLEQTQEHYTVMIPLLDTAENERTDY